MEEVECGIEVFTPKPDPEVSEGSGSNHPALTLFHPLHPNPITITIIN